MRSLFAVLSVFVFASVAAAPAARTDQILIQGNKACEVKVVDPGQPDSHVALIKPGSFTTKLIHGTQAVSVTETGDFL